MIARQGGAGHARIGERGIALVAVLLVLVLLSALAANFTRSTRSGNYLARNLVVRAEAEALADAGVYRAIAGLLERTPERQLAVDGTPYRVVFTGGQVKLNLRDEGGKIDLNRAPARIFTALFEVIGLAPDQVLALADAIADYRDMDNDRRDFGAEATDYRAAGLSYGPKNAPFDAIEELRLVLGMDEELYLAVLPAITVYGRGRRINRNTAPELVLRALVADESAVEARLRGRSTAARTLDTQEDPADADEPDSGSAVRRRYFGAVTITASSEIDGGGSFVREAVVRVVNRTDRGQLPFEILAWRERSAESGVDQPADVKDH